jgi:DNA-binding MarR family transcriptional regulator
MQEELPSPEQMKTNEDLTPDAVAIAHALDEWYTLLGRQFGPLSRPQRRMLHLLDEEKRVRVSELGEALGLTTAGTTRMLDKLEAFGYARRTRIPQSDQRQVYVTLTQAGKQALQVADTVFLERVQAILRVLDEEERVTLAHLLHTMSKRANRQLYGNEAKSEQD